MAVDCSVRSGSIRLRLHDEVGGRICGSSEIQLANPSVRTMGPLTLRVYDLHTVDGHELGGSSVRFDPPVIDELAAGSSWVVGITVSADRPLAAGTYRGVIQSMGAPGFSLALHVDVEDPGR